MAEIRAGIAGRIYEVLVHDGDAVQDGDTVVLLESMKMEIPVQAHRTGVVTKLAVSRGDGVREGDLIAVISAAE